jgi:hypothetical protein
MTRVLVLMLRCKLVAAAMLQIGWRESLLAVLSPGSASIHD